MAWLSDWANRIEITIDDTNVDSNLTNFPILLYLSASSAQGTIDVSCVFDELTSDANRKKIAVTTSDGETQCYVEIERWDDASEKAWLWVKVPSVLASGGATLYLYYDSGQSDNVTYVGDTGDTPAKSVWDANFVGVWHMAQDPNDDVASAIKDSTSNTNDGTPAGTMTTADLVDGKIGKAIDFDGSDDLLTVSADPSIDMYEKTALTVCAIIDGKSGSSGDYGRIVDKCPSEAYAVGTFGYLFSVKETDSKLRLDSLVKSSTINARSHSNNLYIDNDEVAFICMVYNRNADNKIELFVDGVETTYDTQDALTGTVGDDSSQTLYVGNRVGNDREFDGILDEVHISSVARSVAWIKATYYSSWDDFVAFSSTPEEYVADVTKSIQGVYDIYLQNTIEGKYDLDFFQTKIQGIYDILLQDTVQGVYDISFSVKTVQGIYDIYLQNTIEGEYDILLQNTIEGVCDIYLQDTIQGQYEICLKGVLQALYEIIKTYKFPLERDSPITKVLSENSPITTEWKRDSHIIEELI